jgi:hypothetical protein
MIDTQQQYINLNIRGEISIIVVQHTRAGKEIYAHKRTYLLIMLHLYIYLFIFFAFCELIN